MMLSALCVCVMLCTARAVRRICMSSTCGSSLQWQTLFDEDPIFRMHELDSCFGEITVFRNIYSRTMKSHKIERHGEKPPQPSMSSYLASSGRNVHPRSHMCWCIDVARYSGRVHAHKLLAAITTGMTTTVHQQHGCLSCFARAFEFYSASCGPDKYKCEPPWR